MGEKQMRIKRLTTTMPDFMAQLDALLAWESVSDAEVSGRVREILQAVRERGDAAVVEYTNRFDRMSSASMSELEITQAQMNAALGRIDERQRQALEFAVERLRIYHEHQKMSSWSYTEADGTMLGQQISPLDRVGLYVPGGKAAYPSTAIMTAVPARIAGVRETVVVSPAGDDGAIHPALAAACSVLDVDEVWAVGGAQAIGALAHGAGDLRRVQKIVGPGNAWVTAAKLAVYGVCAIDLPAGPSEVLVMADATADPTIVAADLLCQAEHGPDSPALLVTDDPSLPDRVENAIDRLLPRLGRGPILEQALRDHGMAIVVDHHESMAEVASAYAGEHVTVLTADPVADAARVGAAGSIYVGRWSPESAGDYATGANHVLPTGGLGAACGPLSVEDFGSWTQVQYLDESGLATLLPTITTLSGAEGLDAHGLAAAIRFD